MERPDFLKALHDASKSMKVFLTDSSRRWLTNLIAVGRDHDLGANGRTIDTDRIYEIMCFFSVLADIRRRVNVECIEGDGPNSYRIPYGPGNKKSFAFFRFEFDGKWFDLCCGTGVTGRYGSTEHPDISLQRVDSHDAPPLPGELVAIWDGKYHEMGRIDKPEIAQMNFWFDVLDVPRCSTGDVLERLFSSVFQVSSLITNANRAVDYGDLMLHKGFSVVLDFGGIGTGNGPNPSRTRHLSATRPSIPSLGPASPTAAASRKAAPAQAARP